MVEPRGGWTWSLGLPACGGHEKGQERNERATERPDIRDTALATGNREEAYVELIRTQEKLQRDWGQ